MNLVQYVKPHPVFPAHESSARDYHLHHLHQQILIASNVKVNRSV